MKSPTLLDPPLVTRGKFGAIEAGKKIQMWFMTRGKRIDLVVSSPLTRCLQTASLAFLPGDDYPSSSDNERQSRSIPIACTELPREAHGVHYPDKRRSKDLLEVCCFRYSALIRIDCSMALDSIVLHLCRSTGHRYDSIQKCQIQMSYGMKPNENPFKALQIGQLNFSKNCVRYLKMLLSLSRMVSFLKFFSKRMIQTFWLKGGGSTTATHLLVNVYQAKMGPFCDFKTPILYEALDIFVAVLYFARKEAKQPIHTDQ